MPKAETVARPFSVLIVEDEYFIADDLARALDANGITTVGPVARIEGVRDALASAALDFAVVDINIEGSISFEAARELDRRGVPFMFVTGYDRGVLPPEFKHVAMMQKPQDPERIVAEVLKRRDAGASGRH